MAPKTTRHLSTWTGAVLLTSVAIAGPAVAQDAVMTTADTVTKGDLVVSAYPVLLPVGDNEAGALGRLGYGLSDRLAVRAHLGLYNDLRYFGAGADVQLSERFSLGLGVHRSSFKERAGADILGLDLALVGRRPLGGSGVLYGGFDLDFERPEEPYDAFTRAHAVAGLQRQLVKGIDLLVEGGLGLNDSSPEYVSVGLALLLD